MTADKNSTDDNNVDDVHAAQGLLRARGGAEVVIQQRQEVGRRTGGGDQ